MSGRRFGSGVDGLPGTAPRGRRGGSGGRIVTLGETMALLRAPGVGSLVHLPSLDIGVGGAESNAAIGLARLGADVAWVGRVGADELGDRVLREIRAEGVDVRAVVDPERPTGLMVKSHPRPGSTRVRYYRAGSAGSMIAAEDLPDGLVEGAAIVHLTGITPLLSETARRTVLAVADRARAAGVAVSLDVNHRSALASADDAAPILAELARRCDILFGGAEELVLIAAGLEGRTVEDMARALVGPADGAGSADGAAAVSAAAIGPVASVGPADDAGEERLLRLLAGHGIGEVVDKRGSEGAWALDTGVATGASSADAPIVRAAPHRVHVVDTVGAGDAFVAGYLSARLEGLDLAGRLARGNACGAIMCQSAGDWEGAARPADLLALAEHASGTADPVSR
ncbi:sugar kinase [Brachybacterium sp. DNPG3]